MDMLISYFNGKDFLALYIYRNMYFQISFLIFYMPFLSHPLRPLFVTFIPVLSIAMMIYSSSNSLLLLFSVSFILYFFNRQMVCSITILILEWLLLYSISSCDSFISLFFLFGSEDS